jgi:hypothetical protein
MKTITTLILLFLFSIAIINTTNASQPVGSVFVYKADLNQPYFLLQKGKKNETNTLVLDKTYFLDKESLEISSVINDTILCFPNELFIKIKPSSEFRIDNIYYNVSQPTSNLKRVRLQTNDFSINLALLKGEAYFECPSVNENSQCTLQTSIVNLGLLRGSFLVRVESGSVLVYVVRGSINVYDNITDKFETIKEGNVVIVFQAPDVEKGAEKLQRGIDSIATVVKKITPNYMSSLMEEIKELDSTKNNVIFVSIDGKYFGIKL